MKKFEALIFIFYLDVGLNDKKDTGFKEFGEIDDSMSSEAFNETDFKENKKMQIIYSSKKRIYSNA